MDLPAELRAYLIGELYGAAKRPFARYHPRFLVEHSLASAKYNRSSPRLNRDILAAAMKGLFDQD